MLFDVSLPLYLLSISILSTLLFIKYGRKLETMFGKREIKTSETVALVLVMGLVVTLIVFIPNLAIAVLIIAVNSILHFLFFYTVTKNKFVAAFFPSLFLASYLLFWNDTFLNFFASISVLSIALLSGVIFTWRTTLAFAALLTLVDVFHVFVTRFMVISGEKMIAMKLPVIVIMPMFPLEGRIILGLGDIFLTCLLTIQTARKYGFKAGVLSAASISLIFLISESLLLTFKVGFFPATTIIFSGWILFVTLNYLMSLKRTGNP